MKFTKPPLPVAEQIVRLKCRGMLIPDDAHATRILQHISYYRLSAYWRPFEESPPSEGDHKFRSGVTFDQIVALYVFDRELRLHVMDAIERFEVSLRCGWAHQIATTHGPHAYLEPHLYDPKRSEEAISTLQAEIDRSRDKFIEHYNEKYSDPKHPPVWMTAELVSFGKLSKLYEVLVRRPDRQAIAKPYGIDEKRLCSILHHLTIVRNICAHHGRLWNRRFKVTMAIPDSPASLKCALNQFADRNLYNTLATLNYLMRVVAPASQWGKRLVELMDFHPFVDTRAMGFPGNWKEMPAWKGASVPPQN